MIRPSIEIMDTTLRDGEQTDGVSFSRFDKLQIARYLLETLNVTRIEIASARVTEGEKTAASEIFKWARTRSLDHRIEILGFTDHTRSVDWITSAGGSVINLLTKGSRRHCELQLGKNLREHFADIEKTVRYAHDNKVKVNVYLEDWSNGFLNSKDYVTEMVGLLKELPVHRFLLPDTLGIMSPDEVRSGISDILSRYPEISVDFHGHNDYGLAVANCLAAVSAGASGVHVAVNGLGERAGNAPLEAVITALHDKLNVQTGVKESAIMHASRLVEAFSGKRVSSNQPVVGGDVYTQTAGIHADGDKKHNLYANPILPERFGRQRVYALGKLSGKASITNNLKMLGLELPEDQETALLERVKELGEQKHLITIDDLPFLIEEMFGQGIHREGIFIKHARLVSQTGGAGATAEIEVEYLGNDYRASSTGNGGYDAFMEALKKVCNEIHIELPPLLDYEVRIPPGGKTDSLTEVMITWQNIQGPRSFRTTGVDSDQVIGAVKATEKMLNLLFIQDNEKS